MKAVTWIGVDIAKESFVAAQRCPEGFQTEQFALNSKGLKALGAWLPHQSPLQIVLEATGPYWRAFTHGLNTVEPEIPIAVVNPRRVRDFAKASPHASKTDQLDAQVLVHFAETFSPDALEASDDRAYRQLRALTRHALQLTQQRDQVRDQKEKAAADPDTPKFVLRSLQRHQQHLDKALKRCWAQARERLDQDSQFQESFPLLLSIPGVGEKTALTLISEYGAGLGQTVAQAADPLCRPEHCLLPVRLLRLPTPSHQQARQLEDSPGPLHGRSFRHPSQPGRPFLLPQTRRPGATQEKRPGRRHAQTFTSVLWRLEKPRLLLIQLMPKPT